jgi:taurine dioxygenase
MALAEEPFRADLDVRSLTPTIGAEIHGVKLQAVDDATLAAIRQALIDWKVIFFRDQEISEDEHIAFARRFGELEIHPFTPKDQPNPEILRITHDETSRGSENHWHSDVTWRPEPSLGSILRCVECPLIGGDTLFSDMYAAYEALDDETCEQVTGAVARHSFLRAFGRRIPKEKHAAIDEKHPIQQHPVVRTHPETGRRTLYVNVAFTEEIVGLSRTESDALLAKLWSQATIPETQCRFRWEPNSIAFWDNRACQHYAASDYFPQKRVMDRVTICGDRPYFDPQA